MFSALVNSGDYTPFILNVRVDILHAFHKGDIQWLEAYKNTSDKNALSSYWEGIPFNKIPLFEYFLEGTIVPTTRGAKLRS